MFSTDSTAVRRIERGGIDACRVILFDDSLFQLLFSKTVSRDTSDKISTHISTSDYASCGGEHHPDKTRNAGIVLASGMRHGSDASLSLTGGSRAHISCKKMSRTASEVILDNSSC